MILSIEQIEKIAPKPTAFKAGQKLSSSTQWQSFAKSDRSIWGAIKGSGKNPYFVQIDSTDLAYKCSCPSRQFPCKHALALLLLRSQESDKFEKQEEPDYIQDWLNKRLERNNVVVKEEKESTEEEKTKRKKSKDKREDDRATLVASGVNELILWLKDIIRIGLLELPIKPSSFFDQVASKMVDAKSPGLASWVKGFNTLDYSDQSWQEESLVLISKLYLLLKSYQNKEQILPEQLDTIKNLIGWNHKTKDLLVSKSTVTVKDKWLVLGSTQEQVDDLKVYRTWLQGIASNQDAIIIVFESKFTVEPIIHLIDGSTIEAELAFYPDVTPHRAFIKQQKDIVTAIDEIPILRDGIIAQQQHKVALLKQNPWIHNRVYCINEIRFILENNKWIICDRERYIKTISPSFSKQKIMGCLLHSNSLPIGIAIIEKNDGVYPLGVFKNNQYYPL